MQRNTARTTWGNETRESEKKTKVTKMKEEITKRGHHRWRQYTGNTSKAR